MTETEKECQAALATLKLTRGERNDLHLTTVNRALVYCGMPPTLDDNECEAASMRVMLHILSKNNNYYPGLFGLDGLNFWRAATVYQNRKMYRENSTLVIPADWIDAKELDKSAFNQKYVETLAKKTS